jgi:hypothetical protein
MQKVAYGIFEIAISSCRHEHSESRIRFGRPMCLTISHSKCSTENIDLCFLYPRHLPHSELLKLTETRMLIGLPKEIKDHAYRVGLTLASVREFTSHGHQLLAESGAVCIAYETITCHGGGQCGALRRGQHAWRSDAHQHLCTEKRLECVPRPGDPRGCGMGRGL